MPTLIFPTISLQPIAPQLWVALTTMVVLILDLFVPPQRREILGYVGLAGLVIAGLASIGLWGQTMSGFSGAVVSDNFSVFANIVFIIVGIFTLLLSIDYIKRTGLNHGEYYVLVLGALCGMMLMAAATSLITIFLSLELFSLCLYVLSAFARTRPRAQEAGLKYFLLSSFASAFLLYGMALLYGSTGSTLLSKIQAYLSTGQHLSDPILIAGVALVIVGLAFKMSAAPFHAWTPDVYEGAPSPVTAFMSVGTKLAAFAAFVRMFGLALPSLAPHWQGIVWLLAILTMIVGNVAAIMQTSIKRMLAYSGIAHAGYLLVGVFVSQQLGAPTVLFYFLSYTFMNIGAFAVIIAQEKRDDDTISLSDLAGLGARQPWLAAAMTVFMFALAGFPPTAGFLAKFYIFGAAVQYGHSELAVVGVLCSLISVFYYLRVVYMMWMQAPIDATARASDNLTSGAAANGMAAAVLTAAPQVSVALNIVLVIAIIGSIGLGIFPGGALSLVQQHSLIGLPIGN